jgi:phospho-N-acetylmuramoyl-pentapeptide-transferase
MVWINIGFVILFLVVAMLVYSVFLPVLHRFKFGQVVRECGPASHLAKSGTPTLGGMVILFLWLVFVPMLCFLHGISLTEKFGLIFYLVFTYGLIGFMDDFLIIRLHKNAGLGSLTKLFCQLFVGLFFYILLVNSHFSHQVRFFDTMIDYQFLYGPFLLFLLLGTTNATNLTDGMDGLLSGCLLFPLCGLFSLAIMKNEEEIAYMILAMGLSLSAFLLFNLPKASLFMGNVGSYLLGASLFGFCLLLKMEWLLLFFAFVPFCETVSVMLQVWYFKKTKGKRLFKMTPIHHHFELLGFKTPQILFLFWGVSLLFTIIGVSLGALFYGNESMFI